MNRPTKSPGLNRGDGDYRANVFHQLRAALESGYGSLTLTPDAMAQLVNAHAALVEEKNALARREWRRRGWEAAVRPAVERGLLRAASNVAKHILQRSGWDETDECFLVDLREAEGEIMAAISGVVDASDEGH